MLPYQPLVWPPLPPLEQPKFDYPKSKILLVVGVITLCVVVLGGVCAAVYFLKPSLFLPSSSALSYSSSSSAGYTSHNEGLPPSPILSANATMLFLGPQQWTFNSVDSLEVGDFVQLTYTQNVIAYEQGYVTSVNPQTNESIISITYIYGQSGIAYTPWVLTILNGPTMQTSSSSLFQSRYFSHAYTAFTMFIQAVNALVFACGLLTADLHSLADICEHQCKVSLQRTNLVLSCPPFVDPLATSALASRSSSISALYSSSVISSSRVSSSVVSSSVPLLSSSSFSPPFTAPSSSAAPQVVGLVNFLPLQGSYVNTINPSVSPTIQGNPSCASFQSVPLAAAAWTQSCTSSQSPATLALPSPGESGDITIAFYTYPTSYPQEISWFLSCDSYNTGHVDCLQLYYYYPYTILVAKLNAYGYELDMDGIAVPLNQWTHLAVTYQNATQLLQVYINGQLVANDDISRTTATYGAPVLGGEGDSQTNPVVASFINFRQYNTRLTATQVAVINATDYPNTSVPSTSYSSSTANSFSAFSSSSSQSSTLSVDLLHFYPLLMGYSDLGLLSAFPPTVQGTSSCATFTSAGWTQSCGTGSNPATLLAPNDAESGDTSQCVYALLPSNAIPGNPLTLFSCNGYSSGNYDCLHLDTLGSLTVFAIQLNINGNGKGGQAPTSSAGWFHVCAMYTNSTATLMLYLNGQSDAETNVLHTTASFGAPVLAGDSDTETSPTIGSFQNWRIYNRSLTPSEVLNIYVADAPSGYTPVVPTAAPPPATPSTGPAAVPADVVWHIVLTAGQSNSIGTNTQSSGYPIWDTDVMIQMYCYSILGGCVPGTFAPAAVPLYNEINVGFSQTFANLLLPTLPTNHGIVLINTGEGGTGFDTLQWTTSNTNLTAATISAVTALTTALPSQLGGTYVLEAILWHQGENDAGDNTGGLYDAYCQYLTVYLSPFVDVLRALLPGASATTPFVNGGLLPYWITQAVDAGVVDDAIYAINSTRLHTATADSSWIPVMCNSNPCGELNARDANGVVIHFNASQAVGMGYHYYTAYHAAQQLTTLATNAATSSCAGQNTHSSSSIPVVPSSSSSIGVSIPANTSLIDLCIGLVGNPAADTTPEIATSLCIENVTSNSIWTNGVLKFPFNQSFNLNPHIPNPGNPGNLDRASVQLGPNMVIDFNYCTFNLSTPNVYRQNDEGTWYYNEHVSYPNWNWGFYFLQVNSNTTIRNLFIRSGSPTSVITIAEYASDILIDHIDIRNIPIVFLDNITGTCGLVCGMGDTPAIQLSPYNNHIEIKNSYIYKSGYTILGQGPSINNIYVHHNTFMNNTGDGFAIDSSYTTTSYNITLSDNYIANMGWYQLCPTCPWESVGQIGDGSWGFGSSFANCQNITVRNSIYINNQWNNVHTELGSQFVSITNNSFDKIGVDYVDSGDPGKGLWTSLYNHISVDGYSYDIIGNTFADSPNPAVYHWGSSEYGLFSYCAAGTGPFTTSVCVPLPAWKINSHHLNIINNTYQSWGVNMWGVSDSEFGPTQANYVGGASMAFALGVTVTGNSYNPAFSEYGYLASYCCPPNQYNYIYDINVFIDGANQTLTTCDSVEYNNPSLCSPHMPYPSSLILWYSGLNVQSPYTNPTFAMVNNPEYTAFQSFSVSLLEDLTSNIVLSQSNPSLQPLFNSNLNTASGTPGLYFTSGQTIGTTSVSFPSSADYSVVLAIAVSSTANAIIFGSINGGFAVGVRNGAFGLAHNGVWASGGSSPTINTTFTMVVGVTYTHSSGTVQWYVYGTACGSQTLSTSESDNSGVQLGGSNFQGWLFDAELYSSALSSNTMYTNHYYLETNIPIVCYAIWQMIQGSCGSPINVILPWSTCPTTNY